MKTTVDIPDQLFERARRLAAQQGTTMRALIEAGLRAALEARRAAPARFALRDVSFKGDGLAPGVELEDWPHVRSLIYDEVVDDRG
jgi:hypothetical protein